MYYQICIKGKKIFVGPTYLDRQDHPTPGGRENIGYPFRNPENFNYSKVLMSPSLFRISKPNLVGLTPVWLALVV
jgi:hypothetical protein